MKSFYLVLIAVLVMPAVCIAHPEDMPKEDMPNKAEGETVKAGQFVLKNPRLAVDVMKPGDPKAAYAGSRFEWGATILQVTLDGKHTFCSAENPGSKFHGYGLSEEMGIGGAVGFKQDPG
ncbi:MAG: hypothetical protein QGD94_04010, partial [Planctomycetia bacterium]|nr:hypothetical protein [Planctomycetia bacterium]